MHGATLAMTRRGGYLPNSAILSSTFSYSVFRIPRYTNSLHIVCVYLCMYICTECTVPDTSYLRGSEVFRSFSAQVSVKVCEDICSATAPLPRNTCADSTEGFTTGLCTTDCIDSR